MSKIRIVGGPAGHDVRIIATDDDGNEVYIPAYWAELQLDPNEPLKCLMMVAVDSIDLDLLPEHTEVVVK